jgi:5'-3' exonuclease
MKINLIIDGNYLLNRDVFILFETKTLYSELLLLLKRDFEILSKMYNYDNIYFISDSKVRWRKQIYQDYKSNRKPNEIIDWNFVYEQFNIFKEEICQKKNIKHYEIHSAEGDDLIAYIVNNSNKKGYSNVIMCSDSDLHQLLKFNISEQFINLAYNYKYSDERLYLPVNYNVFIYEMSKKSMNTLFDMNEDNDFLEFIYSMKKRMKIVEISNEELLFCKIITGDKNDGIPSVYIKNDRGIGKTGGLSIYNLYKEIYKDQINFESDEFINNSLEIISYNKKINEKDIINDIKNNIIRNRQLIMLNENYLPDYLLENIKNNINI